MKTSRAKWLLGFLTLFVALNAFAAFNVNDFIAKPLPISSSYENPQVSVKLIAYAPQGVSAGTHSWLGILLTPKPNWHTYWSNPGDAGMATSVSWKLPSGITVGDVAWPTPEVIKQGDITDFGYKKSVLLTMPLVIDKAAKVGKTIPLALHVYWLACKTECLPQDAELKLDVPTNQPLLENETLFKEAFSQVPQPFSGSASLAFDGKRWTLQVKDLPPNWVGSNLSLYPEIPNTLDNKQLPIESSSSNQSWQGNVWHATLLPDASYTKQASMLGFIDIARGTQSFRTQLDFGQNGGYVHSMTADASQKSTTQTLQVPESLWLILIAAFFGGVILNLMPCVFPVLAIKVLGVVNHQEGRKAHAVAYAVGVLVFMMALGGTLLLLRAGGENLGWGFQLQSPLVLTILAILFALIGLNLAGVLEVGTVLPSSLVTKQLGHPLANSFFSGLLAVAIASPCTAPFMGAALGYALNIPTLQALSIFASLGLGLAAPYVLLCWVPALLKFVPKPGLWMEQLRQFFAFPMWLTVIWLLWVMGNLNGINAAFSLLALLVCIAMLIWALHLKGRKTRWVYSIISLVVIVALSNVAGHFWVSRMLQPGANATQPLPTGNASSSAGWQPWSEKRVQEALEQKQTVLVDYTAAWCITCQYNKTVLDSTEVQTALRQRNVLTLVADWTARNPAITNALKEVGRSGVPTAVFYSPNHAPIVLNEVLDKDAVLGKLEMLNLPINQPNK